MSTIETELVRNWVEQAVLGLNLCPFAGEHWHAGRVRLTVSPATSEHELLEDLRSEITRLDTADPSLLETTLLIVPNLLQDFEDYNQFLDPVDQLLEQHGWTGRFQIASFHPNYQFAEKGEGKEGGKTAVFVFVCFRSSATLSRGRSISSQRHHCWHRGAE